MACHSRRGDDGGQLGGDEDGRRQAPCRLSHARRQGDAPECPIALVAPQANWPWSATPLVVEQSPFPVAGMIAFNSVSAPTGRLPKLQKDPDSRHAERSYSPLLLRLRLMSVCKDRVINERMSITTGTDKHTPPAVRAAVLPIPATARAKKMMAAILITEVKTIANVIPCLLASISASVTLAVFSIGPLTANSAMEMIRSAEPGTMRSYPSSSMAGGRGEVHEYPTTSTLGLTGGKSSCREYSARPP